jgi:hypothetical protein
VRTPIAIVAGLVAMLLAACGGGSETLDQIEKAGVTNVSGDRIDLAGAPYALTVPDGLKATSVSLESIPLAGGARFLTGLESEGPGAAMVVINATWTGEVITDSPDELATRYWITMGAADAGMTHEPFEASPLGGQAGFRMTIKGQPAAAEHRGATIGEWLVSIVCLGGTDERGPACEKAARALQLRSAPPPVAAEGGVTVAPTDSPFSFVSPPGFDVAGDLVESQLHAIVETDHVSVMSHSLGNQILVTAYADTEEPGELVDSAEFCRLTAAEYEAPLESQRLDQPMGGVPSAGCTLTAPASDPPTQLMPGDALRIHVTLIPGWIVQVTCASTSARRADVDRGCDHVLDTIQLG